MTQANRGLPCGIHADSMRRLDCFYTRAEIARLCMEWLRESVELTGDELWVEPSAGAGSFYLLLPTERRIGMDIAPAHSEVTRTDFLSWFPTDMNHGQTITIGNPPFGKNASTAVRFFNHAATFASCIAMIFPRTFRKASVKNRLNRRFHLRGEWILPENSFEFAGQPYSVPAVFQVWVRGKSERQPTILPKTHDHFNFVPPHLADFAVQRVGCNAGRVKMEIEKVSPSSHYFLNEGRRGVIEIFKKIDWSSAKYDTAGNPSLSKADIVRLYAERLGNAF